MKPEDYERRARELDAEAERTARAGDIKGSVALAIEAEHLRRAAAELRQVLPNTKRRGNVTKMTDAQKADRALAIGKARTRGSKDRLQQSIQKSVWKTHNRYARERLGISPGMLTGYKNSSYPVPSRIADLIRLDFGLSIGRSE